MSRYPTDTGEACIIRVTDLVWIGESSDLDPGAEDRIHPAFQGIKVVFNCAADLDTHNLFGDVVEYVHLGLVDGPGNTMADYHAALLKLCGILCKKQRVMVHDHEIGSRTVALVIMALHAMYRRGWDYWLGIIREKTNKSDLTPHLEHRKAFNRVNWRLVSSILEE